MERKNFLLSMMILPFSLATFLAACKEGSQQKTAAKEGNKTYTCPMHPQIMRHEPGTCPICGMDLVPFDKNQQAHSINLSDNQIALANITTITVGEQALSQYTHLNGKLVTDPQGANMISSRVPGRIENLYVRESGVRVTKGQPLYRIYSEQLASLQQEYLVAIAQVKQFPENERFRQIEKAAHQRLRLYDQSDTEISQLLQNGKVQPYILYPAPAAGIVSEVAVTEGQYVAEGAAVLRLENYDQLWVEADLYPSEASLVRAGKEVTVQVAGWENDPQTMKIQFINPAIQNGTQLLQVRGTISNPANRYQPGMQANILLATETDNKALPLPVDAVIRDGKGTHVWIETGKGKFEPRRVKTGVEDFNRVEITQGLKAGDKVVATGAYLLYSELILKKGGDLMAEMPMSE